MTKIKNQFYSLVLNIYIYIFSIRDGCLMSFPGWWPFPRPSSVAAFLITSSVKVGELSNNYQNDFNEWIGCMTRCCVHLRRLWYRLSEEVHAGTIPHRHLLILFVCSLFVLIWDLVPLSVQMSSLRLDLIVCIRSLCQFFSMGVSSVFTLLLCGNTTFSLAVAFVSATMGLTTFSHRYRHLVLSSHCLSPAPESIFPEVFCHINVSHCRFSIICVDDNIWKALLNHHGQQLIAATHQ